MTVIDEARAISVLTDEVDQYLLLLRDLVWRVLEGVKDHAGRKKGLGHFCCRDILPTFSFRMHILFY